MHKALSLLLPAMLLAGCGAHPLAAPLAAQPAASAMLARSAASPFYDTFNQVALGRQTVMEAVNKFTYDRHVSLPLGPQGEIERVTQVMVDQLGNRPAGNGEEFIGNATFYGTNVPGTFITHQKRLPFRLVLNAHKQIVSFDYEHVSPSAVKIVEPEFKPLDDAERQKLEAQVRAFMDPIAKPGDNVISALFGRSERFVSTITKLEATPGGFGEYSRVIALTLHLAQKDGSPFGGGDFGFRLPVDTQGHILSIN